MLCIVIISYHFFRGHALLSNTYYIKGFAKEELLATTIAASVTLIYVQYPYTQDELSSSSPLYSLPRQVQLIYHHFGASQVQSGVVSNHPLSA
jgi:hypothetical protein